MMNRAMTLSLSALAGVVLSVASTAMAQPSACQPGDLFCAEAQIGPGYGSIRIGPANPLPPPPPQVIIPAPQPPVVYVQPQPPPPPPIQPPVVVYQPAPPPPPPQQFYYQPQYVQPPVYQRVVMPDRYPDSSMGLQLQAGGMFSDRIWMGGAGGGLRIRPNPYVAVDLGLGIYGGQDYNGLDRVEVPMTADFLVFFNPYNRFQFYGLLGVGGSWAHTEGRNSFTLRSGDRDLGYLGGELGLGVEWRINPAFALNFDVRGFLRQRIDASSTPEFSERFSDGTIHSTDTSGGVVGRLGMTFYWGQ